MKQLEAEISSLELRQTYAGNPSGDDAVKQAYRSGVKQHQELFDDTRAELGLAQQRIKDAGDSQESERGHSKRP